MLKDLSELDKPNSSPSVMFPGCKYLSKVVQGRNSGEPVTVVSGWYIFYVWQGYNKTLIFYNLVMVLCCKIPDCFYYIDNDLLAQMIESKSLRVLFTSKGEGSR